MLSRKLAGCALAPRCQITGAAFSYRRMMVLPAIEAMHSFYIKFHCNTHVKAITRRPDGDPMKIRTFLVEDNQTILDNLVSTLEELAPVETIGTADSEDDGAAWLNTHKEQWDLAIVDLFLKRGSGLGILEACQSRAGPQKLVVFSNDATKEMRLKCAQLGVDAVFDKSTEIDALVNYCAAQGKKLDRPTEVH